MNMKLLMILSFILACAATAEEQSTTTASHDEGGRALLGFYKPVCLTVETGGGANQTVSYNIQVPIQMRKWIRSKNRIGGSARIGNCDEVEVTTPKKKSLSKTVTYCKQFGGNKQPFREVMVENVKHLKKFLVKNGAVRGKCPDNLFPMSGSQGWKIVVCEKKDGC